MSLIRHVLLGRVTIFFDGKTDIIVIQMGHKRHIRCNRLSESHSEQSSMPQSTIIYMNCTGIVGALTVSSLGF